MARKGESPAALQGFIDYVDLGPRRSMRKLIERYQEIAAQKGEDAVPTLRPGLVQDWSRRYNWQDRIKTEMEQRAAQRQYDKEEQLQVINKDAAGLISEDVTRLRAKLNDLTDSPLTSSVDELAAAINLAHQILSGRPLPKQVNHTIEAGSGLVGGGVAVVPIFSVNDPLKGDAESAESAGEDGEGDGEDGGDK